MYDLLVIGGGINGTGIARDAAGRGLKVLLCEKDDLASHTSSARTKLIHGGLRYLEHYDFALVRKALKEREVLLRNAPHIIWPMRFVLPHHKALRPAWLIRIGLFLYDHIGGRKLLPPTTVHRRKTSRKFIPLKSQFSLAFEYSDCWVDDARLVVLNAMSAHDVGAVIMTRTECVALERNKHGWLARLKIGDEGEMIVRARVIVNAGGPWVDSVFGLVSERRSKSNVRLVKGSHIVTRKLFDGDHAYFFQNEDGRIIFAIPYENGTSTLIGTTDVPFNGDKDAVEISTDEIRYLCSSASEYFETPVASDDVLSTYSGVRPLYEDHSEDASKVTRDYVLSVNRDNELPTIISVYGGKITTYRKLAEHVLDLLKSDFDDIDLKWTDITPLPGGNIPVSDFDDYASKKQTEYPWLKPSLLKRYLRAYGSLVDKLLEGADDNSTLGVYYGHGLYQIEVDYLLENEFARTAEDILFRRSKLGLHMSETEIDKLRRSLQTRDD